MMKNSEKTAIRAYLSITRGNGELDVHAITEHLNVQPTKLRIKEKTLVSDGAHHDIYSAWYFGVCEPEPSLDINDQLNSVVFTFKDKTAQLVFLKNKYNLSFCINICIEVENNRSPAVYFELETLNFIHGIQAEIDIDIYNYS